MNDRCLQDPPVPLLVPKLIEKCGGLVFSYTQ